MAKINLDSANNQIIFSLNPSIYPLEIILKASYVFIDRIYIYLDSPKKNEIVVALKGKEKMSAKQLEALRGDFLNELANSLLRKNLAKKNQKIVEYIIGGAVTAALEKPPEKKSKKERLASEQEMTVVEKEIEALRKELEAEEEEDYKKDPLGIRRAQ